MLQAMRGIAYKSIGAQCASAKLRIRISFEFGNSESPHGYGCLTRPRKYIGGKYRLNRRVPGSSSHLYAIRVLELWNQSQSTKGSPLPPPPFIHSLEKSNF